ncbi:MAG: hypothetical protein AAGA92_13185 [Planctomycetota bacterium]
MTFRWFLLLVAWGASLYGVLQMHYLHTGFGHSVCGPWGCGPSGEALVGYHGF